MKLYCIGHNCDYEAGNVARLFFARVETVFETDGIDPNEDRILTFLREEDGTYTARCDFFQNGKEFTAAVNEPVSSDTGERILGKAMYKALSEALGICPPWGILTGVRPIKLVHSHTFDAYDFLVNKSFVSEKKAVLALKTAENESRIISLSRPDSFCLYIGIPFCPSRCSYCSFVSKTVENAASLIEKYVDLLVKEINFTGEISHKIGLRLEAVYFGGGTPTVLSAKQLERVMKAVYDSFDMSHLREYTVEGGRPETVDADKLDVLIRYGCRRISINPQTMHDSVLAAVGRRHTASDFLKAYELARKYPFSAINTDLIAGLPTDTVEGFKASLDAVCDLDPENITVHTLCVKRSSRINEDKTELAAVADVNEMLAYAEHKLDNCGYRPYYLYRQRSTVANAENIGYSKPGKDCLYNVFVMDQTHTVVSCGAGGVTILRDPHGSHIERVFNFKYPYEYISRFDVLTKRKKYIEDFYEKYRI